VIGNDRLEVLREVSIGFDVVYEAGMMIEELGYRPMISISSGSIGGARLEERHADLGVDVGLSFIDIALSYEGDDRTIEPAEL